MTLTGLLSTKKQKLCLLRLFRHLGRAHGASVLCCILCEVLKVQTRPAGPWAQRIIIQLHAWRGGPLASIYGMNEGRERGRKNGKKDGGRVGKNGCCQNTQGTLCLWICHEAGRQMSTLDHKI